MHRDINDLSFRCRLLNGIPATGMSSRSNTTEDAFTLVEVLVGLVVFAIAASVSLVFFSSTIQRVYKSGAQGDSNAAIESDIARLKQLAEAYTACVDPLGSIPASTSDPCTASWPGSATKIKLGDAWYYYPNPSSSSNVTDFDNACKSEDPSNHITANLISLLNDLDRSSLAAAGVTKSDATRESSDDFKNHIILVRYTSVPQNIDRLVKLTPVVSAWCP